MDDFQPSSDSPFEQELDITLALSQISEDPYELPCNLLDQTQLSQAQNLSVLISQPQKASSISFLITIQPLGWVCRRTLQDFIWIRNILSAAHAGVYVAPAVSKRFGSNSKASTVSKNLHFLQRFVHSLIQHPVLQRSPYLIGFLKSPDYERFQVFKAQASKVRRQEKINQQSTISGVAVCDPNRNAAFLKSIHEYMSISFSLHRTLKRQGEKLEECMNATADIMQKITDNVKKLQRLQEMLPDNQKAKQTFSALHVMVSSWNRNQLEKVKTIKEYFSGLFKFTYNQVIPFKDLIKEKEIHWSTFKKLDSKVKKTKEKLFVQGDPSKWKMAHAELDIDIGALKADKEFALSKMMFDETLKVQRLRDVHGFHNSKLAEEIPRFLNYAAGRNIQNFLEMGVKDLKSLKRFKSSWKTFLNTLNQLKEGI